MKQFKLLLGITIMLLLSMSIATAETATLSHSFTTDENNKYHGGVGFVANLNVSLINVVKANNVDALYTEIYNEARTVVLANSSFSGDIATFDYTLIENTKYYVLIWSGGTTNYHRRGTGSSAFPEIHTNINYTNGLDNGLSEGGAWYYNVVSIETTIPVDETFLFNVSDNEGDTVSTYTATLNNGYEYATTNNNISIPNYTITDDHTIYGNDLTANGYTLEQGTLQNGVIVNNTGMHFDGIDDGIDLNEINNVFDKDFTFSLWVKSIEYSDDGIIFSNYIGSGTKMLGLETTINNNHLRFCFGETSISCLDTGHSMPINKWELITVKRTISPISLLIYINNSIIYNASNNAQADKNFTISGGNFWLGRDNRASTTRPFNGSINNYKLYNHALSNSEITEIYNAGLYGLSPISDGLILQYNPSLYNSYNSSSVFDMEQWVSNGNYNTTTDTGYAARFDGTDDYYDIGSHMDTSAFTISAYFNTDLLIGNSGGMISNYNGGGAGVSHYGIEIRLGKLNLLVDDGTTATFTNCQTPLTYSDGLNHLVVGTFDGNKTLKIYIDGDLKDTYVHSSSFGNLDSANSNLLISKDGLGYFTGFINNIAIYNRSLSQSEITTLHNNGTVNDGLVAYYPFEYFPNVKVNYTANITTTNYFDSVDNALVFTETNNITMYPYPYVGAYSIWDLTPYMEFNATIDGTKYEITNYTLQVPVNGTENVLYEGAFFDQTTTETFNYSLVNTSQRESNISLSSYEIITEDLMSGVNYYIYNTSYLSNGVTADVDNPTAFITGIKIDLDDDNYETYITGFGVFNGTKKTTATKGYVLNTSKEVIATGDIVNYAVEFDEKVQVYDGYYLVVDDDPDSYTYATKSGVLPITVDNIIITNGIFLASEDAILYNIQSIDMETYYLVSNPFFPNAGTYNLATIKDDYYNQYQNITVTAKDETNYNITGLYDSLLTINAKHFVGNATINEFNHTLYESNNNYTVESIVTTGSVTLPVLQGYNYTSTILAYNFTTSVDVISSFVTDTYNYYQYLYGYNSLLIYFKDIITKLTVENVTMDLINTEFSDNYSTSNGTMYITNLIPATYTAIYTSDDYQESFYQFTIVDDSAQNISLYLIETNDSDEIVINVLNEKARNQEGALVKALRFDITTNAYYLQEMCTTDYNGECYMSLSKNDEYYKIIINYNGETLLTSDPFIIRKDNLVFSIITTGIIGDYVNAYNDINNSLEYNNVTTNWRLDYDDTNGLINNVELEVYKLTGSGKVLVNSTTLTGASGTILLSMVAESGGIYVANAYADGEFLNSASYEVPADDVFSELGLFLQIMLTLVMVGFSLYIIEAIPITLFVSLLIGRLINLNILPYSTIFTGITLGIIILWWLKKK